MQFLLVTLLVANALAQTPCPPLELVYARATTEPPQNAGTGAQFEAAANRVWSKGYGAAGYSLFTNLTALVPDMAGYPVHYPAGFQGCTSEDPGIQDMINHLRTRAAACPSIKFALGGHSQGGFVTARTLARLPKEINEKIIAVTMFGSPPCIAKLGVAGRCKSYCYKNDEVCDDTGYKSKGKCVDELVPEITGGTGKGKGGLSTLHRDVDLALRQGRRRILRPQEVSSSEVSPAECLKGSSLGAQEERGLAIPGAGNSHMKYNSDGRYIREAACYVYRQFAASQGKGAQSYY